MPNPAKLNGEFLTIGGRLFYVLSGAGRYFRIPLRTA